MPKQLSIPLPSERFWKYVHKTDSCWLWTGGRRRRYGRFTWAHHLSVSAHRASWMLHYGKIPDDLFVCHHCDTPLCVKPDHLFLGTHQDNVDDMVSKNRQVHGNVVPYESRLRGSLHRNSVLNENQVREIKLALANGSQQSKLALQYEVSKQTILQIKIGKTWRHVLVD